MVVVGPRRQNQVGFPLPDLADDFLARLERREQLAVVVVEDHILDPDSTSGLLRLRPPARRQCPTPFRLVTRVAVRDRNEADVMSHRGEFRRGTARALIAIVRVGAKRNDVQLTVGAGRLRVWLRGLLGAGQGRQRKPQDGSADDDSSH
jgi:hypothetical protein